MCTAKLVAILALFGAMPVAAQQIGSTDAVAQVVSRIITRENQEMGVIRQHTPLVETYIQNIKVTENDGSWQPDGDHYFIGRADFSKGVDIDFLGSRDDGSVHRMASAMGHFLAFGVEFLPRGFLQMIFLDNQGLDTQNYSFDYVHREFLGDVRTLVFDVKPSKKGAKGRFIGRIWVEDQGFTIVRFNGAYSDRDEAARNFHFDSWRVNAGPDLWLPAFIYSEENTSGYKKANARMFKAQTRLWGYNAGRGQEAEELSKVLVESAVPVKDQSAQNNDLSPMQESVAWDFQAQDNVMDKLQRLGLVALPGDVDKILNTVVNNLEVTNNLSISPDIRCRVLMTSTIESFSFGKTIVLSRGLIDVLPDEASLASVIAKEMGYVLLDRKVDTRFAFYDRMIQFDDNKPFEHLNFERNPDDDAKATAKGLELLKNSPYKDQLGTAQAFVEELQERAHEIPNLISPRVGDTSLIQSAVIPNAPGETTARHIVALPLGGRVKLDPWDDSLELLKTRPVGAVAEREKMPFEITPFVLYLTRVGSDASKSSQLSADPAPAGN